MIPHWPDDRQIIVYRTTQVTVILNYIGILNIIQGVPGGMCQNFGRVFLMLNYTDITQNTYIQSWTVTEIMAREVWNFWQLLHTYWLPNSYWNWQEYVVSVMLISVLNVKLTCEWHKAIKLNYKNTRTHVIVVLGVTKHFTQAAADA